MQTRHSRVIDPLDVIAHDVRRDGRLFGHRQIARARAHHRDGAGPFGQRLDFQRDAAGGLVVTRLLELLLDSADLFHVQPGNEQTTLALGDFPRDADHLRGRFAPAINDLGKTLAQRAMRVHLCKSKVRNRRRLECGQRIRHLDLSGTNLFQYLNGIRSRHNAAKLHDEPPVSRRKTRPFPVRPPAPCVLLEFRVAHDDEHRVSHQRGNAIQDRRENQHPKQRQARRCARLLE